MKGNLNTCQHYILNCTRFSPDGRYEAVNYNDGARTLCQHILVEDVYKVYRALKVFYSEMNKQENKIEIKLCSGMLNILISLLNYFWVETLNIM